MKFLLHWKPITLLFFSVALVDAQSYDGSGSTVPIDGVTDDICVDKNIFVADNRSLCWYYQCSPSPSDGYKLFPKRCALGTYASPSFTVSQKNPCTLSFPIAGSYDCTRSGREREPDCTIDLKCKSGEKPVQEDNRCWCECRPGSGRDADCGTAQNPVTGTTPPAPPTLPCPNVNWCAMGAQSLGGAPPCQNGGTCINQCVNFVCSCPVPYTKTRYCEQFSCTNTNFTCSDRDQTCTRGLNGKDEFYVCRSKSCADYFKQWT